MCYRRGRPRRRSPLCHPPPSDPEPTNEPTPEPTAEPTVEPTPEPTVEPTVEPTPEPTAGPTTTDGPVTLSSVVVSSSRSVPAGNGTVTTKAPAPPVVTAGAATFAAAGSFAMMVLGAAVAL